MPKKRVGFRPTIWHRNTQIAQVMLGGQKTKVWEVTTFPRVYDFKTPIRVCYDVMDKVGVVPIGSSETTPDWDWDGYCWHSFPDINRAVEYAKNGH